jgi:phage shock protein B
MIQKMLRVLAVGILALLIACVFGPLLLLALPLCVLMALVLLVIFLFNLLGARGRSVRAALSEEARFIQGFNASLASMEKRIETLETILLDRTKSMSS